MISGLNPWFPILSIKILEYALVFQNVFIDSIIEQAALISISTAAHQFRCKPAFFACNLHSFGYISHCFLCVLFFVLNNVTFTNITNHNDYHKIR